MAKKTDLIGYCGIYCATCPGYTQIAANLADSLEKELQKHKFERYADVLAKIPAFGGFKYYEKGSELLKAITRLRCPGCRKGGGSPDCKIRICAKQKGFAGCWQCGEFKTCKKFKPLEQSGDTAYIKNIRIIRKSGTAEFLKTAGKKA